MILFQKYHKTIISLLLIIICIVFAESEKESIAVLQLNGTISEEDLLTLTDKLINEIIETAEFDVFERSRMNEILMEQKFQQSDCSSSECAVEVGQLLGVRKIVFGNIGKIGNVFSISIRLINVETGKIIETASVDLEGSIEDVLRTGIKQAVYKLVGLEYKELEKKPIEKEETVQNINKRVKRKRIFGTIAAASAVISGAAAAYFWNDKESIHNDKYLKTTVQADMDRYIEEEKDANLLFWICTGISSVTLPTSIILFVVKPNKKKKAEVSINTRISPVKASVSLVYTF